MKKRVLALLMVIALVAGVFAGCGGDNNSSQGGTSSTPASKPADDKQSSTPEASNTNASGGPADCTEPYDFTVYYNYTGWNKTFGQDETSKFLCDKFNISVNWYGPDSDPDAKLNLMVSSDDLPESIILDRGPMLNKIARAGLLQDLAQYMYEGNTFEQDVTEGARAMQAVDALYTAYPTGPVRARPAVTISGS